MSVCGDVCHGVCVCVCVCVSVTSPPLRFDYAPRLARRLAALVVGLSTSLIHDVG